MAHSQTALLNVAQQGVADVQGFDGLSLAMKFGASGQAEPVEALYVSNPL